MILFFFTVFSFTACTGPTPVQNDDFEASKKFILENERYLYIDNPGMQAHNDSMRIFVDELRANDLYAITKKHKLDHAGVDSYLLALSVSVNLAKTNKAIEEGFRNSVLDLDSIRRAVDSLWKKDSLRRIHIPEKKDTVI